MSHQQHWKNKDNLFCCFFFVYPKSKPLSILLTQNTKDKSDCFSLKQQERCKDLLLLPVGRGRTEQERVERERAESLVGRRSKSRDGSERKAFPEKRELLNPVRAACSCTVHGKWLAGNRTSSAFEGLRWRKVLVPKDWVNCWVEVRHFRLLPLLLLLLPYLSWLRRQKGFKL